MHNPHGYCEVQEYVGITLEVAGKGVDVTVSNLSQVVLPDGGAMTPPNVAVPTPARVPQHQDVPTDPGTGGDLSLLYVFCNPCASVQPAGLQSDSF